LYWRKEMKKHWFVAGFALAVLVLMTGCVPFGEMHTIRGSGNLITQDEEITDFDRVDVSHAFEVEIRQGEAFNVVVRIDDNLVEHIRVARVGSTLKVGLRPDRNYNIRRATMEAEITMPELVGLECSGASEATIEGFESSEKLIVDASGASEVRGDIEAGRVSIDASGASSVRLSGSGTEVSIDASGASDVDLRDFPVGDADVEASGASDVTVNASGTLDADASGASTVYYVGNPTLGRIDTSGASSVKKR
jgi:hypothetical protein